ncbi:DgyrCDS4391 [Dimorphilus gyrociliatus]|uniref:DgyrCDS4391 n=1 Tax=Dimorphilus gyrociliatus TaxID=2664684 RepID=A0A7I8VJI2_9ANNE|nr:DgyrCDS4391 [Dimorphilus gyrociliatus]
MSHTYSTGRTRANQTRPNGTSGARPTDSSLRNHKATPETSAQDRMVRVDGAFTVIPPDAKKRDAIQRAAKKEEENYDKFKARSKKVYNEVGTPGGGLLEKPKPSPASSNLSNRNYLRLKREEYRSAVKKEESKKLEDMKQIQRNKALVNKETEKQRQKRLESDRRRKNEAFLNKLENKEPAEYGKNLHYHNKDS